MKARVSIIIPCYNALPFLKETLSSVFQQTYTNIEVLAIDDGSADGTLDYLKSLKQTNLKVYSNKGKGACAARNYGLKLAQGDFIQFLDADDLLSPAKIEEQVQLLKKNPNRVAVCSTVHFYEEPNQGKIVDQAFMFSTDQPHEFLLKLYGSDGLHYSMVGTNSWLTPKAIIETAGYWNESLSKDQDGEFFCRVLMASGGVVYTPNVLNYYRKHRSGTNIANKKERRHVDSQLAALKSKIKSLKAFEHSEAYKNAFALQYKLLAIDAYPEFREVYRQAWQQSQFFGGSSYLPVLGGRIVELIKTIFGWRFAKLLKQKINALRGRRG
jgi:glycosyltransferase involved in cell wall biosynthesis